MPESLTIVAAYDKGWTASQRTRTYDLDAAEARFESRYGTDHTDAFIAGWSDYAADRERYASFAVR